jgi:putative DNA primase/helicase
MMNNRREKTIESARGRWEGILTALGVEPGLLNKRKHQPCPLCNAGIDRYRWTDWRADGGYICNVCGGGTGMQLLMQLKGWDFRRAANEVDSVIGRGIPVTKEQQLSPEECASRLWLAWHTNAELIAPGDEADLYLRSRGLVGPWSHQALRWQKASTAIVARFRSPGGRAPDTVHRTYLTEDGHKVRKFVFGIPVPSGGAIRLAPPAETMGVAEGIETALSAAMLWKMPVWATTGTPFLVKWKPPKIAKHIVVFGDNDQNFAGQKAAYDLAHRLVSEGRTAEVRIPSLVGQDWNDVLQQQGGK